MTPIDWSDDFCWHIKNIDDEHKIFVELINELHHARKTNTSEDIIGKSLDNLMILKDKHFKNEEELMEKNKYPGLAEHKALHKNFSEKALNLKQIYDGGEKNIIISLLSLMTDWLFDHLHNEDIKIGKYLHSKGVSTAT